MSALEILIQELCELFAEQLRPMIEADTGNDV